MTKTSTSSDTLVFDEHWKHPPSGWPAAPLQTGFSPKVADRIIKESLREWVRSPSRSLFRALKNTPSPGAPIFDNLLDQTRFLVSLNSVLSKCKLEKLQGTRPVTRNGRPVMVAESSPGLTISDVRDPKVNNIIRCLATYAARQNVAVPNHERRRLYRGIRTHDVWGSIGITATNILASDIELLSHVSSASRTDSVYENMALSIIQREAAFQLLTSRPLGSLSESTILSFTAQKKMAEYFTNNIGFVVSVDPAAYGFSIVSSPAAEPFLEEKNPVSLKNEAVTILKLPDEFVVPESNIFDCDFDYLAATNDSRAINLLSSSYRGITYNIAGKEVTKTMSFSNKGRGKLLALYSADGKDPMTGREFLGEFGFSPVPTPKTIQDTSIVSIFKRQSHSTKTEHCERIPEDLIDRLKTLTKKVLIERGVIPECVLSEHDQSLNIQCSVNEELSVNP